MSLTTSPDTHVYSPRPKITEMQFPSSRLHIAFNAIEGSGWTGGINYIRNLVTSLRTALPRDETPQITLLIGHGALEETYKSLRPLLDNVLQAPEGRTSSKATRIVRRLGRGLGKEWGIPTHLLNKPLQEMGIDTVFSMGSFGPRFTTPLMAWIYDFQHLHLPEMFTQSELDYRNASFRDTANYAKRVIISSESARKDFIKFAPDAVDKARVLSFVAQVSDSVWDTNPIWVCEQYHLPEKFFYLPNQFWKHKNHYLVIEALKILNSRGHKMAVVCTGNTSDYRDPSYFSSLLCDIARYGLHDQFLILGLIPHAHTFQLLRQSIAVLQPSLFEGWSTTVEEVKSIGKPIILSNIAVHKEQMPPKATFFDGKDPEDLARCLEMASKHLSPGNNLEMEADAREDFPSRNASFARKFLEVAIEVTGRN